MSSLEALLNLFIKNIMKCENINKYLIGNFMYRCIFGQVPNAFSSFSIRNNHIHSQDTRIADHLQIPIAKTDVCKIGIKYRGAII